MANVMHMPSHAGGGKKQRKKLVKQEAKLMLKVEQARKDVQKAQGKVAKAQAQLDDSQKRLQTVEEKLAALRTSPDEQQTGTNGSQPTQLVAQQESSSPTTTATAPEQEEQGVQGQQTQQPQASEQEEQSQQPPADETHVGGAEDTERVRTPGEARGEVLQGEGQELSQEHAVATDMAQAQDQGETAANQEPHQNPDGEENLPLAEMPSGLPEQQVPESPDAQSYPDFMQNETY